MLKIGSEPKSEGTYQAKRGAPGQDVPQSPRSRTVTEIVSGKAVGKVVPRI